jgi:hypothetical protein
MNEMIATIAKILSDLYSTGQLGLLILFVVLFIVGGSAIWLIVLQRQAIKTMTLLSQEHKQRVEEINTVIKTSEQRIREIDTFIKAADSVRQESRESQRQEQTLLKDQLDAVLRVNEGFRQDIQRLNQKQEDLRENIRETIMIGLQEIREKLYEVTVKEILDKIPPSFRHDLECELKETSENILQNIVHKLQQSPTEFIDLNAIQVVVERTALELLEKWNHLFEGDGLDYLAARIAFYGGRLDRIPSGYPLEAYASGIGYPLRSIDPSNDRDRALEFLAKRIVVHLLA